MDIISDIVFGQLVKRDHSYKDSDQDLDTQHVVKGVVNSGK